MITDDEAIRLLELADPARVNDAARMLEPAAYREALHAGGIAVTLVNHEPAPSEPGSGRHRWLAAAAVAATVAVLVGGLMLVARHDDTGGATDQQSADEGAVTRVGFIGLPAEGATPSPPLDTPPVVSISSCFAPIGDPSEIGTLPPLDALWVFADGRLIWQKFEDLPEGANSRSTGLLEQRLTPEGVELMRSEAIAAFSSGEIVPDDCVAERGYFVTADPLPGERALSADNEHLARIIDPWSWLPASAWADREIRAYVPSTYMVAFEAADYSVDAINDQLAGEVFAGDTHQLTAALPAAAADLIDTKAWECHCRAFSVVFAATFTIDEARALAAALDEAGLEQDGLLNAYRLDYQFEFPDERLDPPMHIWFYANPAGCGVSFARSCPWSLPMLPDPGDLANPAGPAAPVTTVAVGTTAPDDTPVAD